MSQSHDRGMKKWAPYASLIEQKDYLNRMKRGKEKTAKPVLSPEQAEEINALLMNHHGEEMIFRYFEDGFVYEIQQRIIRLDLVEKVVFGSEMKLPLKCVVGLRKVE
jgi:hypothetical protein